MNANRIAVRRRGGTPARALTLAIGASMLLALSIAPRTVGDIAAVSNSTRQCRPAVVVASAQAAKNYRRTMTRQSAQLRRDSAKLAQYRKAARHGAGQAGRGSVRGAEVAVRRLQRELACEPRYVTSSNSPSGGATEPAESQPGLERPTSEAKSRAPKVKAEAPKVKLEAPEGKPKAPEAKPKAPGSEPTPEAPVVETTPGLSSEPSPGGLSIAVHGNHFVNEAGQIVTLHGVDISGTEWQCLYGKAFYGPSDDASIAAMAAWHINAVRIPLNEDCWLGINGAPPKTERFHAEIAEYIGRLHAHGMYAILDLHWSAPGATLSHLGNGFEGYYPMADASHAPAFWTSVATYFKTDHAVLFDLFNEPGEISWSCWLNGCYIPSREYQATGMQELVDAVRVTGATEPVMVGGIDWSSELGRGWLEHRPTDPDGQLVASAHVYDQSSISHFNSNIGTVAAQFPVVSGETGETDCADEDIDAFLPWADSHGVSYLAWAWFVGECASYPALISNYEGAPTSFGIGYREHLLATFPAP